ncbi:MAG TPA: glucose-6-phosphate isomerase family protein [Bacillota bacterium]|nr:glucose-6-phosphate isomerase family protein [Bacillota bacterium]HOL15889.1 glucose-6-phosphate isomerase family protein [Bacillota bacterium]HPZ11178.1 glucose-6-phosphate isomerase family protein [Bacillota bacterium]HQE09251.1 glucose-6-phosphate isomerase family protein [Bacillota bacterium]
MIDLHKQSGLPMLWDPAAKQIVFKEEAAGNSAPAPDVRRRRDIVEVLYDRRSADMDELYYMYRGVALEDDRRLIKEKGLRYDITVIVPGTLGLEYVKTAGHYHPEKPGTGLTYPEVYEVLHGRAHYLLQRLHPEHPGELDTVILIAAKPGDKVLIPPHFGHITINPGDDYLIMSNWVAEEFSSIYEPVREAGGGAYFELHTEEGPEFEANRNYRELPPLRRCPVTPVPQLNLITGFPLYRLFQENREAFNFLTYPENYAAVFEGYLQELLAC